MSYLPAIIEPVLAEVITAENAVLHLKSYIVPFISAQDVSLRTKKAYTKNISYFFNWAAASAEAIGIKENILAYKGYLKDRALKASTINAYLTAIRTYFRWLYVEDLVKEDYAKSIKSVDVESGHKKDPVPEDKWKMMIDKLNPDSLLDRRDYIILTLAGVYALRSIEISRLNRNDLVDVKGRKAVMVWGKGKNEADKEPHVISDQFAEELLAFMGEVELDDSPMLVSLSNNGCRSENKRLSTSGIRYAITKRYREVGIHSKRISFHSLRHLSITRLHKRGASLMELRDFARHKSASTTEIYTHTDKFENPIVFMAGAVRSDMFSSETNND